MFHRIKFKIVRTSQVGIGLLDGWRLVPGETVVCYAFHDVLAFGGTTDASDKCALRLPCAIFIASSSFTHVCLVLPLLSTAFLSNETRCRRRNLV